MWLTVLLALLALWCAPCTHAASPAPDRVAGITVPRATPRQVRYNHTRYALYFAATGWSFLGLCAAIRWRIAPRLRTLAERKARATLLRTLWVFAPLSAFLALWSLPLDAVGYAVERAYGFATQPPGLWLADQGKDYLFGLLELPLILAGYWLLRRSPRRWWLWLWAATIPWSLLLVVLEPVVVEPMYNQFRPLPAGPLRNRLVTLADKAGVHGAEVLVVDMSRRTNRLNAYVTGLGPTKRIVLWDTTLRALPDDQVVAIVGHELGHYVLRHIWWSFWLYVAGSVVILWIVWRLLPPLFSRFGAPHGVRGLDDLAGLPLVLLVFAALNFLQTPVVSGISRFEERQADAYGVRLTGLNEAMARAFVTFVSRDYADPDPPRFLVWWFYTHPPIRDRIRDVMLESRVESRESRVAGA